MVYTISTENKTNKKNIQCVVQQAYPAPEWHILILALFDKKKKNKCGRQTWQKTVHARHQNLLRNKKTNEVKT